MFGESSVYGKLYDENAKLKKEVENLKNELASRSKRKVKVKVPAVKGPFVLKDKTTGLYRTRSYRDSVSLDSARIYARKCDASSSVSDITRYEIVPVNIVERK